jgi:2'-5' RNA ligase
MAQSVELTLDAAADARLTEQWARLADAGLPTSQRTVPSPDHRPHLTLYAGDTIPPAAEPVLPALVAGLDLTLRVGSVMLFGPRRNRYVLVRQVVVSAELLELQRRIADLCEASPDGQFGPGRWTPHVTLAPRILGEQVSPALAALGPEDELETQVTACRRWDGDRRTAWWLTR